jgi:hypothetical protein
MTVVQGDTVSHVRQYFIDFSHHLDEFFFGHVGSFEMQFKPAIQDEASSDALGQSHASKHWLGF